MLVCDTAPCNCFYFAQCSYLRARTPPSHQAQVFPGKVKPTDDIVYTFATLSSLVGKEVDWAWQGLTVYPKHSTLPWC